MNHGFVRVAAVTPTVRVADVDYNVEQVKAGLFEGLKNQAKIMVFPELFLTGYTCGDLFLQNQLLKKAKAGLFELVTASEGKDILFFVGLPWEKDGKLYNVAAAIHNGELLGLIPKRFLPNYSEFYEARHFIKGETLVEWLEVRDLAGNYRLVPMGSNLLFRCRNIDGLVVAGEICEDVWSPMPPSIAHALAGASVIINCSASDETIGKSLYRNSLIGGQSARLLCAYIYANAGDGESTQDLVFGGHNIIAENGVVLAESKRFVSEIIYGDIDLERIAYERRRMSTFEPTNQDEYEVVEFMMAEESFSLKRFIDSRPFVPSNKAVRNERCEEILSIQAAGLKKRFEHTGCQNAVLGISGGLDSTLALLVTIRAFDMLGITRANILCVTMPCFGTTDRTYHNACELTKALGAELKEVNIREAVLLHFRDIGHDVSNHDVTYENGQARERTQVLMDLANQVNGMVIGTGDMSELALGWATYNGDHMSMYGVNASVPKTLVRHLVDYAADTCGNQNLAVILRDILDTPVSPELLPPKDGQIAQKTEDLVGPYELHDFFLYNILRFGFSPSKVFFLAQEAFGQEYDKEVILKWLKIFYRRFFSQQFKRSCLPDGPKVGSVAVSPRGDLRMPSDACATIWLRDLEDL